MARSCVRTVDPLPPTQPNDRYNHVSEHFENPSSAAQAGDYRKQKELFDIDAPYQSKKDPEYMTEIFPEQSTPGTLLWTERRINVAHFES